MTPGIKPESILDRTINADFLEIAPNLPRAFVDLLIVDPPYNLAKNYNGRAFRKTDHADYQAYTDSWLDHVLPLLKSDASIYVCADWQTSVSLAPVLERRLNVRNRITWQREKGRGANANWKNCTEDIWFATVGSSWHFDLEAVMIKRRVIAPYREEGQPKDWEETDDGRFRKTCPSNFWDDISIPYWSMPENTDHPTQKPEKLLAKLILASCPPGGVVFDPFLGSGTTSVAAKKLGRRFCAVEIDEEYCLWAEKRLALAETDKAIQGYAGGVFWERNTAAEQKKARDRR